MTENIEVESLYGAFLDIGAVPVIFNTDNGLIENGHRKFPIDNGRSIMKKVKFASEAPLKMDENTRIVQKPSSINKYIRGHQRTGSMDSYSNASSDEVFTRLPTASDKCHWHRENIIATQVSQRIKLIKICLLSLLTLIIESVSGYLSSSLAVYFMVLHLACNLVGHVIHLVILQTSKKNNSENIQLEKYRADILGSLSTCFLEWFVAGAVGCEAVKRLMYGAPDVVPEVMIGISLLAVAVNLINAVILLECNMWCHSHWKPIALLSWNSTWIRLLCDLLVPLSVFVAGILIYTKENYTIYDDIAALFSGFCTLLSTGVYVWSFWKVLTGSSNVSTLNILSDLMNFPGIKEAHDIYVWPLNIERYTISAHIVTGAKTNNDVIIESVQELLHNKYAITHSTIQIDKHTQKTSRDKYALLC